MTTEIRKSKRKKRTKALGRNLAAALAKVKLFDTEARAWKRDLKAAREMLKVPEDRWK
jgi:hypothetical protein